jgi:hypothetical protein
MATSTNFRHVAYVTIGNDKRGKFRSIRGEAETKRKPTLVSRVNPSPERIEACTPKAYLNQIAPLQGRRCIVSILCGPEIVRDSERLHVLLLLRREIVERRLSVLSALGDKRLEVVGAELLALNGYGTQWREHAASVSVIEGTGCAIELEDLLWCHVLLVK